MGSSSAEIFSMTCPLPYLKIASGSWAKTAQFRGFLGLSSFNWALLQLMHRSITEGERLTAAGGTRLGLSTDNFGDPHVSTCT